MLALDPMYVQIGDFRVEDNGVGDMNLAPDFIQFYTDSFFANYVIQGSLSQTICADNGATNFAELTLSELTISSTNGNDEYSGNIDFASSSFAPMPEFSNPTISIDGYYDNRLGNDITGASTQFQGYADGYTIGMLNPDSAANQPGPVWFTSDGEPSIFPMPITRLSGKLSFSLAGEGDEVNLPGSGHVVAGALPDVPVPEPSALAMFGATALGLFGALRRKRS